MIFRPELPVVDPISPPIPDGDDTVAPTELTLPVAWLFSTVKSPRLAARTPTSPPRPSPPRTLPVANELTIATAPAFAAALPTRPPRPFDPVVPVTFPVA